MRATVKQNLELEHRLAQEKRKYEGHLQAVDKSLSSTQDMVCVCVCVCVCVRVCAYNNVLMVYY